MKMLALITDGEGRLRITSTRSPDVLRRDIAAVTGSASLNHVCIPSEGAPPTVRYLESVLVSHRVAPGIYDVGSDRVVAMLARREVAVWLLANLVRPARKLRKRLAYRLATILR